MNLSKVTKVTMIEAGATADTSALTSDAIDMQGFEGVMIVGSIGTANAGNYAKVQQSEDNAVADDYGDVEGTKNIPSANGDSYLIDIYRPLKRYLKVVITRGASTTTGDVYAIQYGAREKPTSQGATIDAEMHVSPAEGTA